MNDTPAMPGPHADWGFIWSGEHNAYWRPDDAGYTVRFSAAGLYSRARFDRIAAGVGPEKRLEFEPVPSHFSYTRKV